MSNIIAPKEVPRHRKTAPKLTPEEEALRPLKDTIAEIEAIQRKLDVVCVMSRYEIGQLLLRDWDKIGDVRQLCVPRKLEMWRLLADRLDLSERILRQCVDFARKYATSEEVERLIERGVKWSHVTHLITLPTAGQRDALVTRIFEEGLTTAALQREIIEELGNRRPGSGKQKAEPKPPGSLNAGLKRASDMAGRLIAEHEHALFCDDFDLPTAIENEPPEEITLEIRDQVLDLVRAYRRLEESLPGIVNGLEESLRWIDEVFDVRERETLAEPSVPGGP